MPQNPSTRDGIHLMKSESLLGGFYFHTMRKGNVISRSSEVYTTKGKAIKGIKGDIAGKHIRVSMVVSGMVDLDCYYYDHTEVRTEIVEFKLTLKYAEKKRN